METITTDVLKDTGFETWYEFHAAIFNSRSLGPTRHQYVFHKGTQEKEVELPISPIMIQALGRAELDVILEKFKLKDLKALFDLAMSYRKGLDARFTMEIVERTKENQIILSRYSLTPRMIEGFMTSTSPISYY